MSPVSLSVAGRRLFLRNGGAAPLSGAAVVLLADREALAQSATVSQTNLHDSAPTQFQAVGDVPTVNSFILPAAASRRSPHSLPGFRAWRAFSVSRGVC